MLTGWMGARVYGRREDLREAKQTMFVAKSVSSAGGMSRKHRTFRFALGKLVLYELSRVATT